jgi:predicted nucleotidyltransferase
MIGRTVSTMSLRQLARQLDLPERTVRRAANEGLIRGERISERRFRTSLQEEAYLRKHWPLLRQLRAALRTEPNVRLAVLFGSIAAGAAVNRSDIDVLVSLGDASALRVAELTGRLERRFARPVQLVRLQDAQRAPDLMVDVLADGRVLVDRDGLWSDLAASLLTWRDRAASLPDLGDL